MSLVAAPTSAAPAPTHDAQYSLAAQHPLPWKTINSEGGKGGRNQNADGGDNGRAAGGAGGGAGGDGNGDENGGEDDDWDMWDGYKKKKEQKAQGEDGEHKRQEEATQRKKDIGLDPALVQDLFGTGKGSHVDFASSEALPLKEGRCLGAGVNGGVYETIVKGVAFAWKRRWCRKKASQQERKEIEILKKVTHHHIVQLVGTYTHHNFLGLLMWPVAVCDMATFFEDIEVYAGAGHTGEPGDIEHRDRLKALGHLDDLAQIETRGIYTYFGCLASAIAYLHKQRIRHKDLKPANVLLYRDSLRLTDFGTSTDFSLLSFSTTDNGDRGTLKYCAPETAAYEPSGRPADMFSLGCTMLELATVIVVHSLQGLRESRRGLDGSYQANLDYKETWLTTLNEKIQHLPFRHVVPVINSLLFRHPVARPSAEALVESLAYINATMVDFSLFSRCCSVEFVAGAERASVVNDLGVRGERSRGRLRIIRGELRDEVEVTYLPTRRGNAAGPGLDNLEGMQKNDPLATQVWRPYSRPNVELPNAGWNLRLDCNALPDQMELDFPAAEALIIPNVSRKLYFCTYAAEKGKTQRFRWKSDWKKHEMNFHETGKEYHCPYPSCPQTFSHEHDYYQHCKRHGNVNLLPASVVMGGLPRKTAFGCGFNHCKVVCYSWNERCNHVADHMKKEGKTPLDWSYSNIIRNLFRQQNIREISKMMFNQFYQQKKIGRSQLSWLPSNTRELRRHLEWGIFYPNVEAFIQKAIELSSLSAMNPNQAITLPNQFTILSQNSVQSADTSSMSQVQNFPMADSTDFDGSTQFDHSRLASQLQLPFENQPQLSSPHNMDFSVPHSLDSLHRTQSEFRHPNIDPILTKDSFSQPSQIPTELNLDLQLHHQRNNFPEYLNQEQHMHPSEYSYDFPAAPHQSRKVHHERIEDEQ